MPLTTDERVQQLEAEISKLRRQGVIAGYVYTGLIGVILLACIVATNGLSARVDAHDEMFTATGQTIQSHKERILDCAREIGELRGRLR